MNLRAPTGLLYRSRLVDAVTTLGMLGLDRRAREQGAQLLQLQPGQSVLDVPSGTGRMLPLLARRVGVDGTVIGIDNSLALTRHAQRRMAGRRNVRVLAEDWLDIELDRRVDAAISVLGLTVFDDWETALDQLLDSVRPGGRVVIVDWLVDARQSPALNTYIRLGSTLAQARPTRPIMANALARLLGATSHSLGLGLHAIAGVVPTSGVAPAPGAVPTPTHDLDRSPASGDRPTAG